MQVLSSYVIKRLLIVALASLTACQGSSQIAEDIVEDKISEVQDKPSEEGSSDDKAVNATKVKPEDWPSIVRIIDADGQNCTAALVSKNTILTAAHCIDQNKQVPANVNDIFFAHKGKIYPYECTMVPAYANAQATDGESLRDTRDIALCKSLRDLPADLSNKGFETVDITTERKAKAPLIVGGYGCSEIVEKPNHYTHYEFDGELRMGTTTIDGVLTGAVDVDGNKLSYYKSNSWADDQFADICQGDSGGPSFLMGPVTGEMSLEDVPRTIIGVNSGAVALTTQRSPGDIVDRRVSHYTDLADSDNAAFIQSWLDSNQGQVICGVSPASPLNGCK